MSEARKVHLREIAQRVGVSPSGVSLALRNHSRISESTRLKVQRVAREMGYSPRKSLVNTRRFGFVYLDPIGKDFDVMIGPAVQLLMRDSLEMRTRFELLMLDDDLEVSNARQKLMEFAGHLEGMLLLGLVHAPIVELLRRLDLPTVIIGETDIAEKDAQRLMLQRVTDDPFRAGFIATQYLLGRGRRRIAFVGGTRRPGFFYDQWYRGYLLAHAEAGVPVLPQLVMWQTVGDPLAGRIGELAAGQQRPDALVWPDATIARKMRQLLRERGLTLDPLDEVIGAASHSPALTGQEHFPQILGDLAAMTEEAIHRLQVISRHGVNRAVSIVVPNIIRNMEI